MQVRPPETEFLSVVEDSRRWERVSLRSDDIVIATPPKCGTTWMQGIVASLLWPDGDAPDAHPWVDFRLDPIEELLATLEALEHRRFILRASTATTTRCGESGSSTGRLRATSHCR